MPTRALAPQASASVGLIRALASLLVAALGACSSPFDGRIYRGDGYTFQVASPPVEWRALQVTGAALAFEEADTGGQILVNARCDRDGDDVSLRSLTQHLFLRFTEREVVREELVPFDGREALRTEVTAKLDGVARRFVVWVMKKDRCVYDLLYVGTAESSASGAGEARFDTWARQFSALPREVSR